MSEDESFVLIVSLVVGPAAWAWWFVRLAGFKRLGRTRSHLRTLAVGLLACGVLLGVVLRTAAAPDVRDAAGYLGFYFVLGFAWLRVAELFNRFVGVSVRDDVLERGNGAAVPAVVGAWLAVMCCYAGGNVGAGPGWWVVVFSAALATIGLGVLWVTVHAVTHINDLVAIDRDTASGVRLGGLLVACGLVLGRAVAGDWEYAAATIIDFVAVGWFVIPIVAVAMLAERMVAPTAKVPQPPVLTHGVVPTLVYVGMAAAYLVVLGWPS